MTALGWGSCTRRFRVARIRTPERRDVIVAATGCLQPEDKIPIAFVEDRIGIEVPLVRRFVPEPS